MGAVKFAAASGMVRVQTVTGAGHAVEQVFIPQKYEDGAWRENTGREAAPTLGDAALVLRQADTQNVSCPFGNLQGARRGADPRRRRPAQRTQLS